MTVWTHDLLDALRLIGDPVLDPSDEVEGWPGVAFARPESLEITDPLGAATDLLVAWRDRDAGARPDDVGAVASHDYWTTPAQPIHAASLDVAHQLFVTYGGEIGASLLLASLPSAYASETGARVLAQTQELRSNARRRIGETAQFVVEVLFPGGAEVLGPASLVEEATVAALPPGGRADTRVRTTRLVHAVIRSLVARHPSWDPRAPMQVPARPRTPVGVPLNQEDLLGTLATFTVVVFEVMEKLGIPWNDEAEQAYLDLWDRVGELLGIGSPAVTERLAAMGGPELPEAYLGALRPKTPREARELVELIRLRAWAIPVDGMHPGPFANQNGKVLVRALLDELQAAVPRGMERLPLFVMRYLVDDRAHELLGLGGGGVVDGLLRWPRPQQLVRRSRLDLGRGAVAAAMRLAANDISRRAFLHFMRRPVGNRRFWFPEIDALVEPVPDGRSP